MNKECCEHISKSPSGNWVYNFKCLMGTVPGSWDICPAKDCHEERPKEPTSEEKLEEELAELTDKLAWQFGSQFTHERQAKRIITFLREKEALK